MAHLRIVRRILPAVMLVACQGETARTTTDSTSIATAAAPIPAASSTSTGTIAPAIDDFVIDSPDSSYGSWDAGNSIRGSHVRHPSGLLTMWLDTAVRPVAGQATSYMHSDSVVVSGLQPGEGVGVFCAITGNPLAEVVGIVRDTTILTRPRLAWIFDEHTRRIKPFPNDSLGCLIHDPLEGEVD